MEKLRDVLITILSNAHPPQIQILVLGSKIVPKMVGSQQIQHKGH